jgi:hypothetical protein
MYEFEYFANAILRILVSFKPLQEFLSKTERTTMAHSTQKFTLESH